MKCLVCGTLLLGLVGCSSDSGSGAGTGGAGNTGGTTSTCGSLTPTRLYSSEGKLVRGVAADASSLYFLEGLDQIKKMPKAGGAATTIATAPGTVLDVTVRLYVDGAKLYYSDNSDLFSVDTSGGTPKSLATSASKKAIGIDPTIAFDEDFIYFGDKVYGPAGEALGTVNKLPKTGGMPTVLASGQAGPGSIAFDETNLYWINEGTYTDELEPLLNAGLGSVPKTGGNARALFTQTKKDGISPAIGDLLVGTSELFFASINLDSIVNTGEYRIAKTGGTPLEFSSCPSFGAFLRDGQLYADCGDRISKFDLETGSETELVCLPEPLEGSILMTNDSNTIYYVKAEPDNAAGDTPYSLYSIPIQ
ncbi:MAG TPA: hypothetical protein VG937_12705 [Polyangiaceae bacterium]|jgi:hypothetical protein|nr:hypothetical protein [Polyangiaceae bacterium]